jgi:hypothetical protein
VNRLIVRDLDPDLHRALVELAVREHLSVSEAAVALMRRGAGLDSAVDGAPLGVWGLERVDTAVPPLPMES